MYSVVLMVALTGGSEAPSFHHHGHGGGGCGCYGYSSCGCCGNYSSCGCCGNYSGCGCCGNYSSCGCCGNYSYGGCGNSCGCCGNYSGCGCCGGYMGGAGGGGGSGGSGGSGDSSKGGKVGGGVSAPATIVVNLPANAKLTVDDYLTTSTASTRTLQTPALPAGQEFRYTLKVEVVRDGKTVTETKQITVRAGQTTESKFDLATAAAE